MLKTDCNNAHLNGHPMSVFAYSPSNLEPTVEGAGIALTFPFTTKKNKSTEEWKSHSASRVTG